MNAHRPAGPSTAIAACLLACFGAVGCASTVSSETLVPKSVKITNTHTGSVRLEARGTGKRLLFFPAVIEDHAFQAALRDTMAKSGVFSSVVTSGDTDFLLVVAAHKLVQPEPGLDMEAQFTADWVLTHAETGATVWKERVKTLFEATSFDTSDLEERLQLAIEGAARENIKRGIRQVSRLEF